MQKCKYLDDLGLKIEDYGANFCDDEDSRRGEKWAKEREEYGLDERETWNLDHIFIEWIYTRVMMYKKCALVNLNYHEIEYKDKIITQEQAINTILDLAKQILLDINNYEIFYNNSRKICDLWKEVLPYMWW